VTWFDHTVFALYSLSFMSMLFLLGALGLALAGGAQPFAGLMGSTMFLAPPVHMFFHLGGAYRLGWFSTLWRTIGLLTICGVSFLIFLVLVVLIGLLG
jgi:hypothetical protein